MSPLHPLAVQQPELLRLFPSNDSVLSTGVCGKLIKVAQVKSQLNGLKKKKSLLSQEEREWGKKGALCAAERL